MRELRLSGGYAGTLATYLSDRLGTLDGATVKGALVAEGAAWPAAGAIVWQAVNVTGEGAERVVSMVVPTEQPAGHFWWWLWIVDGSVSELVLVTDPDDGSAQPRPWHIWVH